MNEKNTAQKAEGLQREKLKAEISEEQGAGSGEKSVVSNQCVSEQWAAGPFERLKAEIRTTGSQDNGTMGPQERLKAEITATVDGGSGGGGDGDVRARGQREFLAALELFMHSAKGSHDPAVRAAAREWEAAVGFSVKVRLQRQREREAARARRRQGLAGPKPAAATASPSTLRIRVYAAPKRD